MINEKIKYDPVYYSISRKVFRALKKEVIAGRASKWHKYCAIDKHTGVYIFTSVPNISGGVAGGYFMEIKDIDFTQEEKQFIQKHWKELIWGLK